MPKNQPDRIIDSPYTSSVRSGGSTVVTAGGGSSSLAAHALNGTYHTGTLGDAQAPQFLKTDGSRGLTGNLAVSAGITIDGVDLSAHAADAEAHHKKAVAGDTSVTVNATSQAVAVALRTGSGLQVSSGLGISLATTSGLNLTSGLALDDSVAGAGLTVSSKVLAVGAGNGISVAADSVAVNLATTSGLNVTSGLALDDSVAGNGLAISSKVLAVGAGNGISVAADSVAVNAGYAFPWTASHTWTNTSNVGSSDYVSQTTGWRVTGPGAADFRYLYAGEMHAKSFVADLEQALAGGQIVAKSVALLASSFTVPAYSGTATLTVRDLPSAPDVAVFSSGDNIRLRSFSRTAGVLTVGDVWGTVGASTDNPDGTQSYTFTRRTSTYGGGVAASTVIPAESLAIDYGTTGNGVYEVSAIDGNAAENSPYARVVTWSGTNGPSTSQVVRTQMGNLKGLFGVANEYGFYAGTGTASTNSYLRLSSETVKFNSIPLFMYNTGGTLMAKFTQYGVMAFPAIDASSSGVIGPGVSWADSVSTDLDFAGPTLRGIIYCNNTKSSSTVADVRVEAYGGTSIASTINLTSYSVPTTAYAKFTLSGASASDNTFDINCTSGARMQSYGTNIGIGYATASSITKTLDVSGTFQATGNSTIGGTLGVTGAATLSSTLAVTGNTTLTGTLTVNGSGTGLSVTNNASVGGTLAVTGNTTLTGTLTVNGAGTALSVTNNASVGGTLAVTGNSTFTGNTTHNGKVVWGQQALTISSNVTSITVEQSFVQITNNHTATVTINNIDGAVAGMVVVLKRASGGNSITFADTANTNAGAMFLAGNFTLTTSGDTLTLIYNGGASRWIEVSRSSN